MRRQSPADELAEIRAEVARLIARAAQIEAALLRHPEGRNRGTWHMAEVTETRQSVFDPSLLPIAVQEDARYQREELCRTVVVIPILRQIVPLRSGWPIRRNSDGTLAVVLPILPLH